MGLWWKRYEPILEARPQPAREVLKDLVAKELVEIWQAFPPKEGELAFEDERLALRMRGRLHELPALDVKMVSTLSSILVWDLKHDVEAIDHLFRNDHHRDAAPSQRHLDALHLLWRGMLEHLYVRKEDAAVLTTNDLVDIVLRARDRFVQRCPPS